VKLQATVILPVLSPVASPTVFILYRVRPQLLSSPTPLSMEARMRIVDTDRPSIAATFIKRALIAMRYVFGYRIADALVGLAGVRQA
jgi:hypothetical protein